MPPPWWRRWSSNLGVAGSLVGLCSLCLAIPLYGDSFSLGRQPLSDLGWGPGASAAVYRGGIATAACLLVPLMLRLTADAWRRRPMLARASALAGCGVLCGAAAAVLFPDQNASTFYVHDLGAGAFIICQPLASIAFTAASPSASALQVASAAAVVCFSGLVLSFVFPLLQTYDLLALTCALANATRYDRERAVAGIVEVAWWFPISETGLMVATYLWYLATAMAMTRREEATAATAVVAV